MKVWSLTPFFNETEVMEIRLATLADVVDVHVVSEADRCYSNEEKPWNFYPFVNTDPFGADYRNCYADKIRYMQLVSAMHPEWPHDEFGDGQLRSMFDAAQTARWKRENLQRDFLLEGCWDMADDDLVFLSDADEIPHPSVFEEAQARLESNWLGFGTAWGIWMPQHVCYLDWRWPDQAIITIARFCSGETLKTHGPQAVRNFQLPNACTGGRGWHLSYMGGYDRIAYKIQNAAHDELIQYADITGVRERVDNQRDLFDRTYRQIQRVLLSTLPPYVGENIDHFASMISPEGRVELCID